jgi:succinate-acetate transporter protein
MGFSIGMGIHFLYDLFPKKWVGGALLKFPFVKRSIGSRWSIGLFIIFTITSFGVAVYLSNNVEELLLFFTLGLILLWLNKRKEEKLIRPTTGYLIIFCGMGAYTNPEFYTLLVNGSESLKELIFTLSSQINDILR